MTLYRTRNKVAAKPINWYDKPHKMSVTLRYDGEYHNGHNTFSITADIHMVSALAGQKGRWAAGGCLHDETKQYFPELAHLIQWHLVSDDGPMHYVANTLHHLGYTSGPGSFWYDAKRDQYPKIEYARSTAVWPDMPESFICHPDVRMLKSTRDAAAKPIREALEARLPEVMKQFHEAMAAIEWDTAIPF